MGPLLRALGLAHHWQRLSDEQTVSSVDEIAEIHGLDVNDVRKLLRLTLLEPRVVAMLAAGAGTSLEGLLGQEQ